MLGSGPDGPEILTPGTNFANSRVTGDDLVDALDRDPDVINAGTGTDSSLVDRGLDRVRNVDSANYPEPDNLARGRPVRASMALPTGPAAFAVDGHRLLFWAAFYARQWIEIDLGSPQTAGRVGLVAAQTPEGETDHVILGRASLGDRWRGLAELKGETATGKCSPRRPRVRGGTSATCESRRARALPGSPGRRSRSSGRASEGTGCARPRLA